jgi:hypothetical protein
MKYALTILSLALIAADLAAAAPAAHPRYVIYKLDGETGAPVSRKLLYQDTVSAASANTVPCDEYYAINEPTPRERKAKLEAAEARKTWYWVGAGAAAVVAGVTAWVLLSGDEPAKPNHTIAAAF